MGTTRTLEPKLNLLGGVETSLPPHLIGPTQWRSCHNMRFTPRLEQIPPKVVHATVGAAGLTQLVAIPGTASGTGKILVFKKDSIYDLNATALKTGLTYDTFHRPWAFCLYNGTLFYTNDLNPVKAYGYDLVDNVRQLSNSSGNPIWTTAVGAPPAGRYICAWFDHLVIANINWNGSFPSRVAWSGLGDFNQWTPARTNEADHFDLNEWQQPGHLGSEITGMAKLRGTLWLYTPTAIIPMEYVGKPKVTQIVDSRVVPHVGMAFPYTLVQLENLHCFYNSEEKTFFAFDGQQVIEIGAMIQGYMKDNLAITDSVARMMHGFVDHSKREIWWVFGTDTATYNRAVIFNYRLKVWSTASVENIQSFLSSMYALDATSTLVGTTAAQLGYVSSLKVGTTQLPNLYSTNSGTVIKDYTGTGTPLSQDDPVLETGDFIYGSLNTFKTIDGIALNASWSAKITGTNTLEIRVSGREFLEDAVDWTSSDTACNPGTWDKSLANGLLTFTAKSGRIFRLRLKGTNMRSFVLSAYAESARVGGAER